MDSWSEKAFSAPVVDIKDCWIWKGARSSEGYARFYSGQNEKKRSTYQYVHRLVYEAFVGPIPEGLHIDHLCRNRACVNPEHLETVTPRVNLLRGAGPPAQNARKTHCKAGHSLAENVRLYHGRRQCRECDKLQHRELRRSGSRT
jgi:hypothetical protein